MDNTHRDSKSTQPPLPPALATIAIVSLLCFLLLLAFPLGQNDTSLAGGVFWLALNLLLLGFCFLMSILFSSICAAKQKNAYWLLIPALAIIVWLIKANEDQKAKINHYNEKSLQIGEFTFQAPIRTTIDYVDQQQEAMKTSRLFFKKKPIVICERERDRDRCAPIHGRIYTPLPSLGKSALLVLAEASDRDFAAKPGMFLLNVVDGGPSISRLSSTAPLPTRQCQRMTYVSLNNGFFYIDEHGAKTSSSLDPTAKYLMLDAQNLLNIKTGKLLRLPRRCVDDTPIKFSPDERYVVTYNYGHPYSKLMLFDLWNPSAHPRLFTIHRQQEEDAIEESNLAAQFSISSDGRLSGQAGIQLQERQGVATISVSKRRVRTEEGIRIQEQNEDLYIRQEPYTAICSLLLNTYGTTTIRKDKDGYAYLLLSNNTTEQPNLRFYRDSNIYVEDPDYDSPTLPDDLNSLILRLQEGDTAPIPVNPKCAIPPAMPDS